MSRTTAAIAIFVALALGIAVLVGGPSASAAAARADHPARAHHKTPQLVRVTASIEVTDHWSALKVVAHTRRARKLKVVGGWAKGVPFERGRSGKFVARFSLGWVPEAQHAEGWCEDDIFVLRGKQGERTRVEKRVCFRGER